MKKITESEKPNRYANSKVYKLVDGEGYYYYGSTCLPLHKRFYYHKLDSNRKPDQKVYKVFTYDRLCNNDIKIILVEELCLENKEQLLKEEHKYIEKGLNDEKCLNSIGAVYDYEKHKEKQRIYEREHRDHRNEYFKEYKAKNSEKIIATHKACREANIEHYREYDRQRNKNPERKQKREAYLAGKYTCICGASIRRDSKSKHEKTKLHMRFINTQNN